MSGSRKPYAIWSTSWFRVSSWARRRQPAPPVFRVRKMFVPIRTAWLLLSRAAGETSRQMKQALHRHVYSSPMLEADRQVSISRLTRMFVYLMDHPQHLPPQDEGGSTPLPRVVCDYLAGMTDRYFFRVYETLFAAL